MGISVRYQANAYRVTLREFWWETKLFFWVALIIKLFRMTPRASTDDLPVDSLAPFEVDESKISPETLARFKPVLWQLQQMGFDQQVVWYDEQDVFQATHNTLAIVAHASGKSFARIQCRINQGITPPRVKFFTTFISRLQDAGFIVTTNGKPDMLWPATHRINRFKGLAPDQLWQRHESALTDEQAVIPITDRATLIEAAESHHASLRDFHIQRGVFTPISESEAALYAHAPSSGSAGPEPQPDLMEIAALAELERIQRGSANKWRSGVAIFLISLLLFVAASTQPGGGWQWDWQYLLIIIPLLLFHELGHYAAMRVFGYRNVKMFFIPFIGAAVSGRHYNVPGWKKVVVSLMGPVPGIVLGIVVAAIGMLLHKDMLVVVGLLSLLLNGFNLLPILPLDGGWVAHAILFSRHYALDIGFRLLAAVALLASGIFLPDLKFMMYVGIAMLISLPSSLKIAKVVREMRGQGLASGASPDGQTIPPETARAILSKVRQHAPRNLGPKLAAQHVLQVFETLNARPPGAAASIGLLALYGGSFVAASVVLFGMIGIRNLTQGESWDLMSVPKHSLNPTDMASAGSEVPGDYATVVISFPSESRAKAAFAEITPDALIAQPLRATLFGQTLLVSMPAEERDARERWFERWEKQAEDVFVESEKYGATLNLLAVAKDEKAAQDIEAEVQAYLHLITLAKLAPPWASFSDWPQQRRDIELPARLLMFKLRTEIAEPDAESWTKLSADITAARKRGNTAAVERLVAEQVSLSEQGERQRRESLRAQYPDSPLVKTWIEIETETDYKQKLQRTAGELGPMLGLWTSEGTSGILAEQGYVTRDRKQLNFRNVRFAHSDKGMPIFVSWLIDKGCADFRYELNSQSIFERPEEEP